MLDWIARLKARRCTSSPSKSELRPIWKGNVAARGRAVYSAISRTGAGCGLRPCSSHIAACAIGGDNARSHPKKPDRSPAVEAALLKLGNGLVLDPCNRGAGRGNDRGAFVARAVRHVLDHAGEEVWLDLIGVMARTSEPGGAALGVVLRRGSAEIRCTLVLFQFRLIIPRRLPRLDRAEERL